MHCAKIVNIQISSTGEKDVNISWLFYFFTYSKSLIFFFKYFPLPTSNLQTLNKNMNPVIFSKQHILSEGKYLKLLLYTSWIIICWKRERSNNSSLLVITFSRVFLCSKELDSFQFIQHFLLNLRIDILVELQVFIQKFESLKWFIFGVL